MFKFFFGLDIQFQFAQNLLTLMHLCDLPPKQKSGNLKINTLKSLLWRVIVYKVEKSNIVLDIPLPCSLKILIIFITVSLFNPIQDGLFRGCSWMREGQKGLPCLKSVTHILQWWNLAQLYLTQRRSKKYMNHVTHRLSSADISIFSPEISKLCYIKKYRYRLYFDT